MPLIIGAGPAGLFAAEHIGECKVLEEHPQVGLPEQCGGLISKTGLEELGVYDRGYVLNEVKGARFFSPSEKFEIKRKGTQASVISRQKFEQYLLKHAEKNGAEVLTGSQVKTIRQEGNKWAVKTKNGSHASEKLVLACGNSTSLVRQAGLQPYKKENFLLTLQGDADLERDSDFVELYFSNKFSKGFFAWTIPAGDRVRVGLGTFGDANAQFRAFQKHLGCTVENQFGALIPIKGPLATTTSNNAFLVGDAAGQVKPTTGGGVVMGMTCAKILGQSLDASYEQKWRGAISRDLTLGLLVHEFIGRLDDKNLDKLFRFIQEENLTEFLEAYGHMDRPSRFLEKMDKSVISRIFALFGRTP